MIWRTWVAHASGSHLGIAGMLQRKGNPNIFGTSSAAEACPFDHRSTLGASLQIFSPSLCLSQGTHKAVGLFIHSWGLIIVVVLPFWQYVSHASVSFSNCTSLLDFHLQLVMANAVAHYHACLVHGRYLISLLPLISEGHSPICLGMHVLGVGNLNIECIWNAVFCRGDVNL